MRVSILCLPSYIVQNSNALIGSTKSKDIYTYRRLHHLGKHTHVMCRLRENALILYQSRVLSQYVLNYTNAPPVLAIVKMRDAYSASLDVIIAVWAI